MPCPAQLSLAATWQNRSAVQWTSTEGRPAAAGRPPGRREGLLVRLRWAARRSIRSASREIEAPALPCRAILSRCWLAPWGAPRVHTIVCATARRGPRLDDRADASGLGIAARCEPAPLRRAGELAQAGVAPLPGNTLFAWVPHTDLRLQHGARYGQPKKPRLQSSENISLDRWPTDGQASEFY